MAKQRLPGQLVLYIICIDADNYIGYWPLGIDERSFKESLTRSI